MPRAGRYQFLTAAGEVLLDFPWRRSAPMAGRNLASPACVEEVLAGAPRRIGVRVELGRILRSPVAGRVGRHGGCLDNGAPRQIAPAIWSVAWVVEPGARGARHPARRL